MIYFIVFLSVRKNDATMTKGMAILNMVVLCVSLSYVIRFIIKGVYKCLHKKH